MVKKHLVLFFACFFIFISFSYASTVSKVRGAVSNIIENKVLVDSKPVYYNISLAMAGDVLIHSPVYNSAYLGNNEYDFSDIFKDIKPIIQDHDLAFYNQESIIGGKELGISSYPLFNSPEEIGDAAIGAGFNLVSLANNHSLDKGETGVLNSLNYWSKYDNVITAGCYSSVEERNKVGIYEKNGVSYTFLSYTTGTNYIKVPVNKEYLVNVYNKEQAAKDIEQINDKVDIVIVSMHWGTQYTQTPTKDQKDIANYLSSLGVDIIIGHHPHVLEPITYIGDTLVIYSLGNFLSNQYVLGLDKAVGAIVSVDIEKVIFDGKEKIQVINPEVILTYNYKDNTGKYKIYPFDMLTNNILYNYEKHYNNYSKMIKSMSDEVTVRSLGE